MHNNNNNNSHQIIFDNQKFSTKDGYTVNSSITVFVKIVNEELYLREKDLRQSLETIILTIIENEIEALSFDLAISISDSFKLQVKAIINNAVNKLGLEITDVCIETMNDGFNPNLDKEQKVEFNSFGVLTKEKAPITVLPIITIKLVNRKAYNRSKLPPLQFLENQTQNTLTKALKTSYKNTIISNWERINTKLTKVLNRTSSRYGLKVINTIVHNISPEH